MEWRRLKSVTAVAVCICITVAIVGCVTRPYGAQLDPAKVEQIEKGVTTRADLETLFGPPQYVTLAGNGERLLFYQGSEYNPWTYESRQMKLQVIIGTNGVVRDLEHSDTIMDFQRGMKTRPTPPEKQ